LVDAYSRPAIAPAPAGSIERGHWRDPAAHYVAGEARKVIPKLLLPNAPRLAEKVGFDACLEHVVRLPVRESTTSERATEIDPAAGLALKELLRMTGEVRDAEQFARYFIGRFHQIGKTEPLA
jgi:hypothetical protein